MRIAILGGGFAGLAVAWSIINYSRGSYTVDLFDPDPIGAGASGLSSGLLHPYTGKQAHRAWEAERSMKETHRLITVATQAISQPVVISKGILRPALSTQQITDFQKCAQNHTDTEWWDKKTCEAKVPGLLIPPDGGGLYIKEGLTLDIKIYLQGLLQACTFHGTQYHQQPMVNMAEIATYDKVVIAMGPYSKNFPPLKNLPIIPVKGQIIELKWPSEARPPPYSLISQKYLVMRPDHKSCLVGSTFEHDSTSPRPDQPKAVGQIMPNIISYFPALEHAEIINVRAAYRASSPNHLPLVGQASDKYYFFTALGSKGLLYHAWVGKRVARALLSQDPKHFLEKIHYKLE